MKLPIIPETMSSDDELTPNAEKLGKVGLLGHFPVPAEETLFSHNEPRGEKSLLENSKQTARLSLQEQALNAFCIGLNICSTVGVVFLNKMCVPSNPELILPKSIPLRPSPGSFETPSSGTCKSPSPCGTSPAHP